MVLDARVLNHGMTPTPSAVLQADPCFNPYRVGTGISQDHALRTQDWMPKTPSPGYGTLQAGRYPGEGVRRSLS